MNDILKVRLLESMEICDVMIDYGQELQEVVNTSAKTLASNPQEDGSDDSELGSYIKNMITFLLLQEDMNRHFSQLITLYKLAKEVGIDAELNEMQRERLDYLIDNNVTLFIVDNGKVIPENEEIIDLIVGQKQNDEVFKKTILDSIRESSEKENE